MSEYRGKRHEPLASEEFIGCCALCGADLGHWWHEPSAWLCTCSKPFHEGGCTGCCPRAEEAEPHSDFMLCPPERGCKKGSCGNQAGGKA